MKEYRIRMTTRLLVWWCGLALAIGLGQAMGQEDIIVSRSSELQLSAKDYRDYIALLEEKDLAELSSNKEKILDFVLSFHSNRILAAKALEQGVENDPKVKLRLENARRAVLVAALMDKEMSGLQYPDFEKLSQERYDAEKSSYVLPEKRKVAHILILPKSPACACDTRDPEKEASEIVKKLESGADFAELAKSDSADKSTSKKGGMIDIWLERRMDGIDPEFLKGVFSLSNIGDFKQVSGSHSVIHIIKLMEVEPFRQLSYDDVKEKIIQKLRNEFRESHRVELRSKAYPDPDTINYDAFESLLKAAR